MIYRLILTLYLAILFVISDAYSQNENFIDSIYAHVVFNDVEVLDTAWHSITKQEFKDLIYRNDTICLFNPTNDKFKNTTFIPGSIFVGSLRKNIDTISNSIDSDYLNFIHRANDEDTGIFLWELEIFRIKKADLLPQDSKALELDSMIYNNQNESWIIDSIHYHDYFLELDSCHSIYKLNLFSNGDFEQFYGKKDTFCTVEIDSFYVLKNKYFDRIVDHNVSVSKGQWKAKDGILYLFENGKSLFEAPYFIVNKKLTLTFGKYSSTTFKRSS